MDNRPVYFLTCDNQLHYQVLEYLICPLNIIKLRMFNNI